MRSGVRRAVRGDVDAAAAVLADAFADYPWTQWTVESRGHAQRVEGLQRLSMDQIALPYGEIWVACDDGGTVMSVAVWMLPHSAVPAAVSREVGEAQARLEGVRHPASVEAEACVARLRPTTPHYYLGAVGTRRSRQRQGFGAAVLAPILDRADRENKPVFLETSASDNVGFYLGLGFVAVSETDIPDGGPHVWAMMRDRHATRS
jgi:GNAT superfamily N-acetyltransferase